MLTYCTLDEFLDARDTGKSGLIVVKDDSLRKIMTYLERATRYIEKNTHRFFFPRFETRQYPVPFSFYDLAVRRYPTAHLMLGQDILEVTEVKNGDETLEDTDYFALEHNVYPKSKLAIKFPHYWGGSFGNVGGLKRYDESVITVTGMWGYADYGYPYDYWLDTTQTTSSLDASQTDFVVSDVNALDVHGKQAIKRGRLIRIDDELMEVVSVNETSANSVEVVRGIRGSQAVAHDTGTTIYRWRVVEDIAETCYQIAKIWREAGISAGARIGVSDVSPGAELSIPTDPASVIRSYQRSVIFG